MPTTSKESAESSSVHHQRTVEHPPIGRWLRPHVRNDSAGIHRDCVDDLDRFSRVVDLSERCGPPFISFVCISLFLAESSFPTGTAGTGCQPQIRTCETWTGLPWKALTTACWRCAIRNLALWLYRSLLPVGHHLDSLDLVSQNPARTFNSEDLNIGSHHTG